MTDLSTNTLSINQAALIIRYEIHGWGGNKTDRAAGQEYSSSKSASKHAGTFVKDLLANNRRTLKEIDRKKSSARAEVRRLSLPWTGDSARIIPIQKYDEKILGRSSFTVNLVQLHSEFSLTHSHSAPK